MLKLKVEYFQFNLFAIYSYKFTIKLHKFNETSGKENIFILS
jgi:hypothetical protein